ncbi:MAG: SDR family oxidoreductase [Myxococcales bacterium FL481]|nr:MAG: SDR family oxidoreductase [Myxococcales bacterium FL481]
MDRRPRRPVVLVTGASSGLGLAVLRRLYNQSVHVVATARVASLPRFAAMGIRPGPTLALLPLDVTDADQRRDVLAQVEQRFGGVDVLINNAGVAYRSVVEQVTEAERLTQMDVNFLAPMALARLVLPHMRAQRWGRIINVSSVGGMMAMPTMAVYSASKFALEGASEALWYEVRPWNVHVTLVQPGFISSESFKNTRFTAASRCATADRRDPYHEHYANMGPFIAKIMRLARATPDTVARRIVRTLDARRPPLRVPATLDAYLFAALRRLLPRGLYHRALYGALPGVRRWGPHETEATPAVAPLANPTADRPR